MTNLRMIAFARVASEPNGTPLYGIMDIIEPLPRFNYSLLRSARLTADVDGYVLVGDAAADMDTYRKIPGLYCRKRPASQARLAA